MYARYTSQSHRREWRPCAGKKIIYYRRNITRSEFSFAKHSTVVFFVVGRVACHGKLGKGQHLAATGRPREKNTNIAQHAK